MIDKIKNIELKNKDENWVAKILNQRKRTPLYVVIGICFVLITFDGISEYLSYSEELDKNLKIQERIDKAKNDIKKIERLKKLQEEEINLLDGLALDDAQPLEIIKRVCDLLKLREVIGSYYVKRAQNKKFSNVKNIEIQISYGDKDLLFLVMKIVSEKLFYMKNIKKTQTGVVIELYKPKASR